MARKPMVTRTIITTRVNVLCLNVVTCEPFNKEVVLPRTYKDSKKLKKSLEELCNTEEEKVVHVVDVEEVETLYGMSEQTFIMNSVILDPETRRPIDSDVVIEEDDEEATEE